MQIGAESRRIEKQSAEFHKELGLRDLVLTQILYVVGLSWVGAAAKLGQSQIVFWLLAMALFYLPQAAVVVYLSRRFPLETTSFAIPIGSTVRSHFRINSVRSDPSTGRCGSGLVFGEYGQTGTGGDSVEVTRIDNRTWHVKSQAAPNDRAYCIDNSQVYEMQVDFLVVAAKALP